MPAVKRTIEVEKGATFVLALRLSDASGPMDLTGYSGRMQIRETMTSPDAALDITDADFTFDSTGHIRIEVDDARTTALTITSGVYDLEIVSPDSFVTRLLEGKVKVSPNVTRPPGIDP